MDISFDVLSWVLLSLGAVFSVISGIGIIRFPDFYSRVHAAGISDTLASALLLSGLAFQADDFIVALKLFMILGFIFITSPVSSHTLVKSAMLKGQKPWSSKDKEDKKGEKS